MEHHTRVIFYASVVGVSHLKEKKNSAFLIMASVLFASTAAPNTAVRCGPYEKDAAVETKEEAVVAAKGAWSSVFDKAKWHSVFGPTTVASFEPYSAVLTEGVWFISGTSKDGKPSPVAYVCASNGAASVSGT